jgi:hypothetical protein
MARKIKRLIEEQENKSKQQWTRELAVEVERTEESLKNLSMQERNVSTQEIVREDVLHLNPLKDPQQCEVVTLREDKNKYGNRNPTNQITGNKAIKLSKKKSKLEKLQEVPEKNSQKAGLQNLNLVGIEKPRRMGLHHDKYI